MFFEFGIKDIIDIVLVALMLYYIFRLMRESRSVNAFNGIMVFVVIWLFVSQVLEMRLLGTIFDKLVSVGILRSSSSSRKISVSFSSPSVDTSV